MSFFCGVFLNEVSFGTEQGDKSSQKENDTLSAYQYVGRAGSVLPTASLAGTEISVDEIRSAAAHSERYPPSLHSALLSSPDEDPNGALLSPNFYVDIPISLLDDISSPSFFTSFTEFVECSLGFRFLSLASSVTVII